MFLVKKYIQKVLKGSSGKFSVLKCCVKMSPFKLSKSAVLEQSWVVRSWSGRKEFLPGCSWDGTGTYWYIERGKHVDNVQNLFFTFWMTFSTTPLAKRKRFSSAFHAWQLFKAQFDWLFVRKFSTFGQKCFRLCQLVKLDQFNFDFDTIWSISNCARTFMFTFEINNKTSWNDLSTYDLFT